MVCLRKRSHKKGPKRFSGKFDEIQAKILRTSKNLPVSTSVGVIVFPLAAFVLFRDLCNKNA